MKGNFGALRERTILLQDRRDYVLCFRSMDRAKTAVIHRLSPKMSIVHPWMICFDLPMPHEVFDLLNKEILGLTRFGIDTPGSVTITFSNLRRLSYLCD